MASESQFSLSSTATAIALVLPPAQATDINAIRSVHDRAFHKWPPHINILYPSVTPEQLADALPRFRAALKSSSSFRPAILLDRINTFSHRKNATVFLQPSEESEAAISQLRSILVEAVGLNVEAGTRDGTFKPHLTLGQASLNEKTLNRLIQKVEPLTGVQWEAMALAVLRRKLTGEMEVIDQIPLSTLSDGDQEPQLDRELPTALNSVWTSSFVYLPNSGWNRSQDHLTDEPSELGSTISVLSYNLLADTFGCSFTERLPLIMKALKDASKHPREVLCLQEVSSGMISDLLNHPFVQTRYPFCSHSSSSILANHLNLVTLSTEPFEFCYHHFEERHKSALVVHPLKSCFEIANIHLTAALKDHTIAAKQRQIASLTSFLDNSARNSGRRPVIAGDFNLATSAITIEAALRKGDITFATSLGVRGLVDPDVWCDAYLLSRTDSDSLDDEEGATFDVQINPLAAESNAPPDQRPQRYDRILFLKRDLGLVRAEQFHRFGLPNAQGQCGSDHFGIGVVLHGQNRDTPLHSPNSEKVSDIEIIYAESDIDNLLSSHLPTQEDREQRAGAVTRLAKILTSDPRLSNIAILPLGSFAMDTYFSDSDVDVLVVGPLAPTAFFNIATARLKASGNNLKDLHYINSLVPVIEVEIRGIKFDVQYCQAPQILPLSTRSVEELGLDKNIIAQLHPSTLRPLNTFRDSLYLRQSIPCFDTFRTAHRYLSLYLRRRGLYSAKFGYLGGVHLSLMLNHVIKRFKSPTSEEFSAASLIFTFLDYYSQFQWASEIVCDPAYPHPDYNRSAREPIVILAIYSPTARPNVASSCSRLSKQTLVREFLLAKSKLEEGDWAWLLRDQRDTLNDFIASFGAFIVISIDMWDLQKFSETSQRGFLGGVESRIPTMMVNLSRIEGLQGQVWPFCLKNSQDEIEPGKQLKLYYLIGVSVPRVEDMTSRKLVQSKVTQAAQGYETVAKSSEHYDQKHVWIQVEMISRKKLLEMRLGSN